MNARADPVTPATESAQGLGYPQIVYSRCASDKIENMNWFKKMAKK
jgi:hypothetical protein